MALLTFVVNKLVIGDMLDLRLVFDFKVAETARATPAFVQAFNGACHVWLIIFTNFHV